MSIDGSKLADMNRDGFGTRIVTYCNDAEAREAAVKVYDIFTKGLFNPEPKLSPEDDFIFYRDIMDGDIVIYFICMMQDWELEII